MLYSFLIAFILILAFQTNVVIEYLGLIGIKFKDYEQKKLEIGPNYTIFDHLAFKYPCFPTRLLVCPICVSTWIGFGSFLFYPPVHYFRIVVVSLFIYYGFSLLRKANDRTH